MTNRTPQTTWNDLKEDGKSVYVKTGSIWRTLSVLRKAVYQRQRQKHHLRAEA